MVPVLSRSREFSLFLDGTGTGTVKNWSRKKYRSRYQKKFWVPSHSACFQFHCEIPEERNRERVSEGSYSGFRGVL